MIRSGRREREVSAITRSSLGFAVCVAILVAVPLSDLDAAGEQCGPEVVDDWVDLQSAVDAFVNGGACSLISLDGNITVHAPLNLFKVDVETPEIPEPISRSLTIDGKGYSLSGDSNVAGFVIYLGAPDGSNTLTIRNLGMSEFGGSGAVSVVSGTTIIERSLFTNNTYESASPISESAVASAGALNVFGRLTIVDSQFERNSGSEGGAVNNQPSLPPRIEFTGSRVAPLQVLGSTFAGNNATSAGGAIYALQSLTMSNSTLSGNSGGTAAALNVDGMIDLDFCTVVNNSGSRLGAAVAATLDIAITNSIVYQNSPKDVYGYENITITSSLVTSQVSVESTSIVATLNDSNIVGKDPLLSPLASYGGLKLPDGTIIRTQPPLAGSPVIDTIELIAAGNGRDSTDQRGTGFPRVVNGRADMGAVEYRAVVVSDPPPDPSNPFPDFDDDRWSLNLQQQVHLPDTT